MLSVLATIGKIVLIILLCILVLLLLLVLEFFFSPLRYRGTGEFDACHSQDFQCDVHMSWILHIFTIHYFTEDDKRIFIFKIFGIPWNTLKKIFGGFHGKEKKKGRKQKDLEDDTDSESEEDEEESEETEDFSADDSETYDTGEKRNSEKAVSKNGTADRKKKKKKKSSQKSVPLQERLKRWNRILTSDCAKEAYKSCKDRLFKCFKCFLPFKSDSHLYFGFDDPSVTGNILAIHGILYPVVSDIITLHPSFEDVLFQGSFKVKGKIWMGILTYHVVRILLDENCREFYTMVKKEKNYGR